MKLTINRITLLFLALATFSMHQAFSRQFNDLIMILDPSLNESEYYSKKTGALSTALIEALLEEAAPIIVSNNIIENYYDLKKQLTFKQKLFNPQYSAPFNLITLTNEKWLCSMHKSADLVLLIPQKYIKKQLNTKSNASILEQCGFNNQNLININLNSNDLLQQIEQHNNNILPAKDFIPAIKSLFLDKTSAIDEHTDNRLFKPWNIYLIGHGGSQISLNVKCLIAQTKRETLKNELINPKKKSLHNIIKKLLSRNKLDIQTCKTLKANRSTYKIIPETAQIAGITFLEFKELMSIFNNHINTSFLYYSTCFAGGYNQSSINEILNELNINFIAMTKGINEQVTTISPSKFDPLQTWLPSLSKLIINPTIMRFTQFFTTLENIFGTTEQNSLLSAPSNPLAAIAQSITSTATLPDNQPFVRIPAIGVFNALYVDKKVKILTHSMAKIHEFENRSIIINDPETEALIVYPSSIKVPLKLGSNIALVSPSPHKIKDQHESIHVFDRIITDNSLASFITELAVLNKSYSTITFIVKKLICSNKEPAGFTINNQYPSHISNLIVQIKLIAFTPKITVLFSLNNIKYIADYTLQKSILEPEQTYPTIINPSLPTGFLRTTLNYFNFFQKKRSPRYWEILSKLQAVPASKYSLDINAYSLLNPEKIYIVGSEDLPYIHKEKDPLGFVIQKLEEKIDVTPNSEKPGAMTKIMLMKQLQSIEKSITLPALQRQKKWLIQQQKPLITLSVTLQRYRTQLTNIKQNVERLASINKLNENEKNIFLQKINDIKSSIDFAFENATTAPVIRKRVLTEE